jgi:signal peptidase II
VRAVQAAGGKTLTGRRHLGLLLGIAAFVLVADIVSKAIVTAHIREYTEIHLIGNVLMLTDVRNPGAAFNLGGTSMTIVFTAIAAAVVIYILRFARKLRSVGWVVALGLLLGGATGNLLDRVFRAPGLFRGNVVDWIEVTRHYPVFNLADSAICCGGVLIALLALRGVRLDGTRVVHASGDRADGDRDEVLTDGREPFSSRGT